MAAVATVECQGKKSHCSVILSIVVDQKWPPVCSSHSQLSLFVGALPGPRVMAGVSLSVFEAIIQFTLLAETQTGLQDIKQANRDLNGHFVTCKTPRKLHKF